MTITKKKDGTVLCAAVSGRLDTSTSHAFDAQMRPELEAGLRVLLTFQKQMNAQGKMTIKNSNEIIMEIFEVTGFSDILTLE